MKAKFPNYLLNCFSYFTYDLNSHSLYHQPNVSHRSHTKKLATQDAITLTWLRLHNKKQFQNDIGNIKKQSNSRSEKQFSHHFLFNHLKTLFKHKQKDRNIVVVYLGKVSKTKTILYGIRFSPNKEIKNSSIKA